MALDLIQGLLLLHPHSKKLFRRELHMTLILDLLEPCLGSDIQALTLQTLICAMVDGTANIRVIVLSWRD